MKDTRFSALQFSDAQLCKACFEECKGDYKTLVIKQVGMMAFQTWEARSLGYITGPNGQKWR